MPHKQSKKVFCVDSEEKIQTLLISRNRPNKIMVPFINAEISLIWTENEHWQWACGNFLEEIDKYPQNKRPLFI